MRRHGCIAFIFVVCVVACHAPSNDNLASASEIGSGRSSVRTDSKPLRGDVARGEELYKASCVVCHGSRAIGGVGPKLAGNPVLSNDQAFWKVVYEGQHVMPPLKGIVNDKQMADIRAWLKTLP